VGARTDTSALNGTKDGSNSPSSSGKPRETEGGQPPDFEGNPGCEGALTGVTYDSTKHRMNFWRTRAKNGAHMAVIKTKWRAAFMMAGMVYQE